jgi:hypothetical protein
MPKPSGPPLKSPGGAWKSREEAMAAGKRGRAAANYSRWYAVKEPMFKGEWGPYFQQVRDELLDHYGAYGPQYRLLCQMVAGTWVNIRRAEQQGMSVDTPHYTKALDLLRKLLDQGQRYTESRKSEVVRNEVNAAVRETLLIVEAYLTDDPDLFRTIVLAVRDRVMGKS